MRFAQPPRRPQRRPYSDVVAAKGRAIAPEEVKLITEVEKAGTRAVVASLRDEARVGVPLL